MSTNPMASNQDFLNYLISKDFKVDIWTGTTPEEKAARQAFFKEFCDYLTNYQMPWYGYNGQVQPKGGRTTTSLALNTGYADYNLQLLNDKLDKVLKAQAPAAAVTTQAAAAVDPAALQAAVDAAVAKILPDVVAAVTAAITATAQEIATTTVAQIKTQWDK